MNANIVVGIVFIVACYGAVSSLSSGQHDERRAVKMVPMKNMSYKTLQDILRVAKLLGVLVECDVSLPQKANLVCKAKRFMEVLTMKDKWKLKVSPYGFALLDVPSPWTLVGRDFVNPFTRFYLEGYLQTVLTTDLSLIVYKGLVNNITDKEISHSYNYRILSKFFEMSAKLGGVRLTLCLFVCLCVFTVVSNYY